MLSSADLSPIGSRGFHLSGRFGVQKLLQCHGSICTAPLRSFRQQTEGLCSGNWHLGIAPFLVGQSCPFQGCLALQALDLDCSRFFEVYHSSRESFLYLQEFYIGNLLPQDAAQVPCPEQPSPEFLAHLRAHTTFRVRVDEADSERKVYKSF